MLVQTPDSGVLVSLAARVRSLIDVSRTARVESANLWPDACLLGPDMERFRDSTFRSIKPG